ncbi:MAG TPA: hypothetical protein PLH72_06565 [Vicinamibacterales bacterium]|nr:hypothetical protein [Vicinamibacterales bacterium]
MRPHALRIPLVLGALWAAAATLQAQDRSLELAVILHRAGEKVEEYFTRAQSLICLEVVRLQPLASGLSPSGFGRTVESELRLSWSPVAATDAAPEAETLRQVVKVNGHPPRENDYNSCTTPEQQIRETQVLSMLLPAQRRHYRFALASAGKVDGRPALVVTYTNMRRRTVEVSLVEGRDDCINFEVDGGQRGKIWLDPDTHEVLRLDQSLSGLVDIPMPRKIAGRAGTPVSWTMERLDTTIRFKPVSFQDPDETIMLPVSSTELRVTRGSGQPRLRTITEYSRYQRFLTGARVVQD